MDKDAELLCVQFICEKCNKPIRGCKTMRIKGKRYHMTCGMNEKFGERVQSVQGTDAHISRKGNNVKVVQ